jgi:hypothetical protein
MSDSTVNGTFEYRQRLSRALQEGARRLPVADFERMARGVRAEISRLDREMQYQLVKAYLTCSSDLCAGWVFSAFVQSAPANVKKQPSIVYNASGFSSPWATGPDFSASPALVNCGRLLFSEQRATTLELFPS